MTSTDESQITDKQREATLRRLERFSTVMDSAVRIPFTRINVGVEAVIVIPPEINRGFE